MILGKVIMKDLIILAKPAEMGNIEINIWQTKIALTHENFLRTLTNIFFTLRFSRKLISNI